MLCEAHCYRGCLSFWGYSKGDEQMGCSLFKVGALPKWTDWEVNRERGGKKWQAREWTVYWRGVKQQQQKQTKKPKSIKSIDWLVAKPLHPQVAVLHLSSFTLSDSTRAVYSGDGGRFTTEIVSFEPMVLWFQTKADFSFLASNHMNSNCNRHISSAVPSKLIKVMLVSWVSLKNGFWLMLNVYSWLVLERQSSRRVLNMRLMTTYNILNTEAKYVLQHWPCFAVKSKLVFETWV